MAVVVVMETKKVFNSEDMSGKQGGWWSDEQQRSRDGQYEPWLRVNRALMGFFFLFLCADLSAHTFVTCGTDKQLMSKNTKTQ